MPDPAAPTAAPRKKIFTGARAAFFIIGCLLIAAALWAITRHADQLTDARLAAQRAPASLIAICLLLPIINWLCTTGTIWTLTARYGRVGFREMLGLIGSAWLLNMLPLRIGMIGRIAYHRAFHGIKVRECAMVLFQALACSVVSLGVLVLWLQVIRNNFADSALPTTATSFSNIATLRTLLLVCVPLPVAFAAFLLARRLASQRSVIFRHAWRWPVAIMFRYADMLTWVARYAVVFAIIGRPMPLMQAAVVTVSAQAAMLTPVQLGLREWAVGATAAFIEGSRQAPPGQAGDPSLTSPNQPAKAPAKPDPSTTKVDALINAATPGLMADVMMRAAELVMILPVGFVSTWWLWRRMKRAKAAAS